MTPTHRRPGLGFPTITSGVDNPASGSPSGYVCVAAGTQGTLNGNQTFASLKEGTNIASVNSTRGLYVGTFIEIEGFGKTQVTSVSEGAVGLSRKGVRTIPHAQVAYSPAVFSTLGGEMWSQLQGDGPPGAAPQYVGQIYCDRLGAACYIAVRAGAAPANWRKITN